MMELRQLQAGYGERLVLNGVDLALRPGEVLALIGHNGSGKSTLIRAALGLIPLAGGQVVIDGVDAASLTPRQRAQKAAYLPQTRPVPNITALLKQLKDEGVWVFGTAAQGNTSLYKADLKGPAAIVIGSEGDGMSRLVAENCDFTVSIPMFGKINSLNASAAAAVLLYEAVRQRTGN